VQPLHQSLDEMRGNIGIESGIDGFCAKTGCPSEQNHHPPSRDQSEAHESGSG